MLAIGHSCSPHFFRNSLRINLHAALVANVKLCLKILSLIFVEAISFFFACFNAHPLDRVTGDSVAEELVAVIVGNNPYYMFQMQCVFPVKSALRKYVCNPL